MITLELKFSSKKVPGQKIHPVQRKGYLWTFLADYIKFIIVLIFRGLWFPVGRLASSEGMIVYGCDFNLYCASHRQQRIQRQKRTHFFEAAKTRTNNHKFGQRTAPAGERWRRFLFFFGSVSGKFKSFAYTSSDWKHTKADFDKARVG